MAIQTINIIADIPVLIHKTNVDLTIQDAKLIATAPAVYTTANFVIIVNGTEQKTIFNIDSYNAVTGTITFISGFESTGEAIVLIFP